MRLALDALVHCVSSLFHDLARFGAHRVNHRLALAEHGPGNTFRDPSAKRERTELVERGDYDAKGAKRRQRWAANGLSQFRGRVNLPEQEAYTKLLIARSIG